MTTRIKICGIRDPDMARIACAAGADAVGLMFYKPSTRHLQIDQAVEIRKAISPFSVAVAVMVNPSPEYVREIITRVRVDRLQFHGDEADEWCADFGLPFVKVLRVAEESDPKTEMEKYPSSSAIMFDTHVAGHYGGSGKRFDWNKAVTDGDKPIILAGGLSADNVVEAIRTVRPYGVDVSSGVESDGVKDPGKIRAFCNAVRAAD